MLWKEGNVFKEIASFDFNNMMITFVDGSQQILTEALYDKEVYRAAKKNFAGFRNWWFITKDMLLFGNYDFDIDDPVGDEMYRWEIE